MKKGIRFKLHLFCVKLWFHQVSLQLVTCVKRLGEEWDR